MKKVILLLALTLVFSQIVYAGLGFSYGEYGKLPYPLRDAGSAVLGDKIYVIGGITTNNISSYVLKLDQNGWKIITNLPTPVYASIGFGWNGKIYVIGGFTMLSTQSGILAGATSMTDLIQIYDLKSNSWSFSKAPLKLANAGYVFNGTHLIVVGGYVGLAQFSSSVYVYNPSQDTWTKLPDLPVNIFSEAVGYYHKAILVVGGISSSVYEGVNGNFKVYGYYDGKWYVIGNVTNSYYSFAYTQYGDTLYIIGGVSWSTSQISDKILAFKILTPPFKPIITQVKIMNHSVYLSWRCMNASYYKVIYWNNSSSTYYTITTQNYTIINNLANGVRYYFQVIPYNEFGEGDPSDVVSAVPGTVPLPPKILSVLPGNNNLTVTWIPSDNGGYPIIGYYIGIDNGTGNIKWIYVGNYTSYTISNLKAGSKYTIYLIAKNELGNSTPAISYGIPQAIPKIIEFNYTSLDNNLLILSWRSSYNATFTIKIYNKSNVVYEINTNNSIIKVNIPYGNYTVLIISKNLAGTITFTQNITHYIPPSTPIVSLGITQNSIVVIWSPVPYALYYEVFLDGKLLAKTTSTEARTTLNTFGTHVVSVVAYNPAGASKPYVVSFNYTKPAIAKVTGSILLQQNLIAVANVQQTQEANSSTQGSTLTSSYLLIIISLIVVLSILVYIARKV